MSGLLSCFHSWAAMAAAEYPAAGGWPHHPITGLCFE